MTQLSPANLKGINYVGAFLTLACPLSCSYCINRAGDFKPRRHMTAKEWIRGLSRIPTRNDLPITLQGGEPTAFKGFYEVVAGVRAHFDLLTNAHFDLDKFVGCVPRERFGRIAPYAPIRISYHHETMHAVDTLEKAKFLQRHGFKVGIWAVRHPRHIDHYEWFSTLCAQSHIDFRWKEYLAKGYGTYRYPQSVYQATTTKVECRTSEILIAPDGRLHRCHADLYAGRDSIGHILDRKLPDFRAARPCRHFGQCNPCDVKVKHNRFQVMGHSSVEVNL